MPGDYAGSGAHGIQWMPELRRPRGTPKCPEIRTLGFGIVPAGTKKQERTFMSSPAF